MKLLLSDKYLEYLYINWNSNFHGLSDEWRFFFEGFVLAESENVIDCANLEQFILEIILNYIRDNGYNYSCVNPLKTCFNINNQLIYELIENIHILKLIDNELISKIFFKYSETIRNTLTKYCHQTGYEFGHLANDIEKKWIIMYIEHPVCESDLAVVEQLHFFEDLYKSDRFEYFINKLYPAQKRFSLEGAESIILALKQFVTQSPNNQIADLVLGMAHRGRLNVLANIFYKPIENIVAEFKDTVKNGFIGDGDVKYHKGYSCDVYISESKVHLTLASNPSHLEAVNPVVIGKCRARQLTYGDEGHKKILPILIHGDSAFTGQGSVAETLNLSKLDGYFVGGTIHLIINNQIGFTTIPRDYTSSTYSSDVAKNLSCPIFHVQGESPEDVVKVVKLALEYRQKFSRDVVIDLVCYRRHGHNEADEPMFTQPLMYTNLVSRPSITEIYRNDLREKGVSEDVLSAIEREVDTCFENALSAIPKTASVGFTSLWEGVEKDYSFDPIDTSIDQEQLLLLARRIAELPPGFCPHPKLCGLIQKRFESVLKNSGIDWGTAETLVYASLLAEGVSVRLSGQDSRRGTFSHRHAVLHDINDDQTYTPLLSACNNGATFQIWDSPLSEFAVLGFEYGYSLETPHGLTIWEAQFGDFANGAQVIIDQFISSGETKWNRASGLVMYLPHGYEGQGAEHSSARIERFLQLCSGNNMTVVNPSTPAQMFHLLRRHMKQSFRKPLIVFTPKSLLRHPQCISHVDDFTYGGFSELVDDFEVKGNVERVLLCSGKIYYELIEERTRSENTDTAIIRVEQLYPLRMDLISKILERYPLAALVWVQEEPRNMGAWMYLNSVFSEHGFHVHYVGRDADCCPAVGSHRVHEEQQRFVVSSAFAK